MKLAQLLSTVLVLLIMSVVVNSQNLDKVNSKSQVEEFSSRDGTLILKEFHVIGKFKKYEVSVAHFTDLMSETKQSGVRFEMTVSTSYSTSNKVAFLDPDEIDALINSINIIKERILPRTPTGYQEVSYKSRGGFESGCFWSNGKSWKGFTDLEKYGRDTFLTFNPSEFDKLLVILHKAKTELAG